MIHWFFIAGGTVEVPNVEGSAVAFHNTPYGHYINPVLETETKHFRDKLTAYKTVYPETVHIVGRGILVVNIQFGDCGFDGAASGTAVRHVTRCHSRAQC